MRQNVGETAFGAAFGRPRPAPPPNKPVHQLRCLSLSAFSPHQLRHRSWVRDLLKIPVSIFFALFGCTDYDHRATKRGRNRVWSGIRAKIMNESRLPMNVAQNLGRFDKRRPICGIFATFHRVYRCFGTKTNAGRVELRFGNHLCKGYQQKLSLYRIIPVKTTALPKNDFTKVLSRINRPLF